MQAWARQDDIVYCRPLVKAGDRVVSVQDGLPTWVCEVMSTKPTLAAALEHVRLVEAEIDKIIAITPDTAAKQA